jgi:hypothetical protein
MIAARHLVVAIALGFSLFACVEPEGQRPGMRLAGEVSDFPGDWRFSDAYREIAIEVATPYFISHSVTIWCAALNNSLYVGARNPEEKYWPGWVERDPNVRLRIADRIFEGRLALVEDAKQIESIRAAYKRKYDLPDPPPEGGPPMRYWRVEDSSN